MNKLFEFIWAKFGKMIDAITKPLYKFLTWYQYEFYWFDVAVLAAIVFGFALPFGLMYATYKLLRYII